MKTPYITSIIMTFVFAFLPGCKDSTSPSLPQGNYSPLNIGDQLQLVTIADSATQFFTVLGNIRRQDGTAVFAIQEKIGAHYTDTVYRFVRDGYLIATQIDSVTWFTLSGNPFAEARIAKVNPTAGESWVQTLSSPDTVLITATYVPTLTTMCGVFENVFALTRTQYSNGQKYVYGPGYYANLIGYVGYDTELLGFHSQWRASYIKCGDTQMGSLWPDKEPPIM
ncbi:MAG: hypothetical protein ABSD46_12045 [Bacteroidota bacterium]